MRLVIEIPEDDLDAIKYLKVKGWASRHELLILNGTPLPKGHGRLIDADALYKEVASWGMNDYEPSDFLDEIDRTPTIIEKEGKE